MLIPYAVEIIDYEELSDNDKKFELSNNGSGIEYSKYLRVKYNNEVFRLESDGMEPEDVSFTKGLAWVKDALVEAFDLGRRSVLSELLSL